MHTKQNYEASRILDKLINPSHFITISLNKSICIDSIHGSRLWLKGDDIRFNDAFQKFIDSISKELVSKHSWRRHKPRIQAVGSIEGIGSDNPHVHVSIEKPMLLPEQQFIDLIRRKVDGNRWFKKGPFALEIQPIFERSDGHRTIGYSLKKGYNHILLTR